MGLLRLGNESGRSKLSDASMFNTNIYIAEFEQKCSVCLVNSITLYYTREDVSQNDLINDLIREGWLDITSVDDMFWKVFKCEVCRNHALIV